MSQSITYDYHALETALLVPSKQVSEAPVHEYLRISCASCGHSFDVPVYCGDRFCPVCSYPRRLRVRSRLNFLVDFSDRPPGMSLKFLTLTIRSEKDPEKMFTRLTKAFKKLRSTAYWKKRCFGGASIFEVTHNDHGWHVHVHILMISKFMDFDDLLPLWQKLSTGRGVYIKAVGKRQGVNYLTKYLSKPEGDVSGWEMSNKLLHGRRLFQPFGAWHALSAKYVKPPCLCKKCGCDRFMPQSLMYGDYPESFYKPVPT